MQEGNYANQVSLNHEPKIIFNFEEDGDVDSYVLDTLPRSEDKEDQHKFLIFKIHEYGDEVRLELGLTFTIKSLVRDEVKFYAIEKKNDSNKIVVYCGKEVHFP